MKLLRNGERSSFKLQLLRLEIGYQKRRRRCQRQKEKQEFDVMEARGRVFRSDWCLDAKYDEDLSEKVMVTC